MIFGEDYLLTQNISQIKFLVKAGKDRPIIRSHSFTQPNLIKEKLVMSPLRMVILMILKIITFFGILFKSYWQIARRKKRW